MAAGRKPQPAAAKENETAHLTKAELKARADNEPKGCPAELKPPKTLSKSAKNEWKRIVKLYRQLDAEVINDLDLNTLSAYCESVAIYQAAQAAYPEEPLVDFDKDGKPIENPYLAIMRKEGVNIAKYAEQLCLSPVGRARMGVLAAKKNEKSDMAQWMERKRKNKG